MLSYQYQFKQKESALEQSDRRTELLIESKAKPMAITSNENVQQQIKEPIESESTISLELSAKNSVKSEAEGIVNLSEIETILDSNWHDVTKRDMLESFVKRYRCHSCNNRICLTVNNLFQYLSSKRYLKKLQNHNDFDVEWANAQRVSVRLQQFWITPRRPLSGIDCNNIIPLPIRMPSKQHGPDTQFDIPRRLLTQIETILNSKMDDIAKVDALCRMEKVCDICDYGISESSSLYGHLIGKNHRKNLKNRTPPHLNFGAEWSKTQRIANKMQLLWNRYKCITITELKEQIETLRSENEKLKAALSEYLEVTKPSKATKKLKRQYEECRAAAIALRDVGRNLPSAALDVIEWAKDDSVHFTQRSKKANEYRVSILKQEKYASLGKKQYLIENNGLNDEEIKHHYFTAEELNVMKEFVIKNEGAGNIDPDILVNRRWMKYESLSDVLGIQPIHPSNCSHLTDPEILRGQRECFAKLDIPKGTILGQYVGTEMLQSEFHAIYNGTREEMHHLSYMHGETLLVPNGGRIELYVDGIGAGDKSPFLYINDGRSNIRENETTEDAQRMNVEFVGVLCNGWPIIFIRSTKPIKAADSLWINYGSQFGLVLDEQFLEKQRRDRIQYSIDNILAGIDLEEDKGLEIFSDSESDDNDLEPIKKMSSSETSVDECAVDSTVSISNDWRDCIISEVSRNSKVMAANDQNRKRPFEVFECRNVSFEPASKRQKL